MNNVSVNVASFKEAFVKFLSFIENDITPLTLQSFAKLKTEKVIKFENDTVYFDGNHSQSSSYVELILVEKPIIFYVVKFYYFEVSQNSNSSCKTFIFVPNE
jgi:hypothetical protein